MNAIAALLRPRDTDKVLANSSPARARVHNLPALLKARSNATGVAMYTAKHVGNVSKKASKVTQSSGQTIAKKVARLYGLRLLKQDSQEAVIQAILSELNLTGLSVDVTDAITPDLIDAFNAAGIVGIGQVGMDATPDMTNHLDEMARTYAKEHAAELVTNLTSTTKEALRGEITRAVESGMSTDELSRSIRASFAFSESRADVIARTELASAHVSGNVQGWRETGVVIGKRSILGDLHDKDDVCDECAAAGTVGIDDDFVSGYAQPPYHPNCICDVVPVLKGEE